MTQDCDGSCRPLDISHCEGPGYRYHQMAVVFSYQDGHPTWSRRLSTVGRCICQNNPEKLIQIDGLFRRQIIGGRRRTNTTAEWTGPSYGWRVVGWFLGLDISLIRPSWAVGLSALIINTDTKSQNFFGQDGDKCACLVRNGGKACPRSIVFCGIGG